jgi:DNA-binding Xre family transcriptional regulator
MTGKIVNNFMLIKKRREEILGMVITLEKIAKDTGIAYSTIHRYSKSYVDRYDSGVLMKLCDYFEVEIGDLLKYEKS